MLDLKISKIYENVWQLGETNDFGKVDAYLIVGEKRAALIDCLQDTLNLYDTVRTITDLPFDVYITHGHFDHLGKDAENLYDHGCKIYMDERDFELPLKMHGVDYRMQKSESDFFTAIHDGDVIDLGGTTLTVIEIPGHSPGSVVFLDRENQRLYSGDGIGSGYIWLQIPFTTTLSEYTENLRRLRNELDDCKDLVVLPGHRFQSPVLLRLRYVDDLLTACEKILSGELVGREKQMDFGKLTINYRTVSYGDMRGLCYDPTRL